MTEIYSAKIMNCPSCGAGFLSTGTQTAGVCVYCGSTGAFESRTTPVPAPRYIIPFAVTKEACLKRYDRQMHPRIFAPANLRRAQYQAHFRALYVPYWDYHITQEGESEIPAWREREGVREQLLLRTSLDARYQGIFFDASEPFDDRIASEIAPFYYQSMQNFSPEDLSGTYAGMTDVPASVYERSAKDRANAIAAGTLPVLEGVEEETRDTPLHFPLPQEEGEQDGLFHTRLMDVQQALFPVWMLTWRRRNRIAYAVMNGQTGRMHADHPVDLLRFVLFGGLFALPLFALLLFGRPGPWGMLGLSLLPALCADALYAWTSHRVRGLGYAVDLTEVLALGTACTQLIWAIIFWVHPGSSALLHVGTVWTLLGACLVMGLTVSKHNLTQTTQMPGTVRWIPAFLKQNERVEMEKIQT